MSDTEATEGITLDEVQALADRTTEEICRALDGAPLLVHLGIAQQLVKFSVMSLLHNGLSQEAIHVLRSLDAEIREFHDQIITALVEAQKEEAANGQEKSATAAAAVGANG